MYRCDVCKSVSEPKMPRIVHHVLRTDGSIAHEIPVCKECSQKLKRGTTLNRLRLFYSPQKTPPLSVVVGVLRGKKLV